MVRQCERCGDQLSWRARADARFCSTRCRVAAHRASRPPAELRQRPRWIRRSGSKVPLTIEGRAASSTNPATWSTWEQASRSNAGVGLGFVLDGDGIVCIDLDHCLDGDEVAPWAADILDQSPATWVEISPSGDGLHIWGRANFRRGRRIPVNGGTAEIYGSGRYITISGRRFRNAPTRLADLDDLVGLLVAT